MTNASPLSAPHDSAIAPAIPHAGAVREQHAEAVVNTFTRLGAAPRLTFPLALMSVTIAVLAMHFDLISKYSLAAYWIGVFATLALAVVVGHVVSSIPRTRPRLVAALVLPTAGGAIIGVLVQAVVLSAVSDSYGTMAIKDLGGLVDSTEPVAWLGAGVVLGALPALLVSAFLVLASRALRSVVGNDAAEGFGVAFTGCAGLLAAIGLVIVAPWELPPLFAVTALAGMSVLIAFLVDGARLRFLSGVWQGVTGAATNHARTAYEIVPASRFMHDPMLSPIVTKAGAVSVLVRIDRRVGSYRAAAAEPIAMLADTEHHTTLPVRRRRAVAVTMLMGMGLAACLSVVTQPELGAALGIDSLLASARPAFSDM